MRAKEGETFTVLAKFEVCPLRHRQTTTNILQFSQSASHKWETNVSDDSRTLSWTF